MNDSFDDQAELAAGRGFTESTDAPDWIVLSASAPAVKLYLILRMRLNRKRRDRKVWPGRANLAVSLDVKTTDTVTGYLKELENLGAIDIGRTKTVPSKNIYRINHEPPSDYMGPRIMEDWDRDPANSRAADVIRAAEKDKRDRAKAKAKAAKEAQAAKKAQVSAGTGSNRYLRQAAETSLPGTGSNGYLGTGSNPHLDTGSVGSKPLGVSLTASGTIRTTSSSSSDREGDLEVPADVTVSSVEDQKKEQTASFDDLQNQEEDLEAETKDSVMRPKVLPQLTEWEQALVDECVPLGGPSWDKLSVRKVVGSRRIREVSAKSPELVRRAFLLGATNRRGVTIPIRLWFTEGCPHWREAERQLSAADVAATGASAPVAPEEVSEIHEPGAERKTSTPLQRPSRPPAEAVQDALAKAGVRIGAAREMDASVAN